MVPKTFRLLLTLTILTLLTVLVWYKKLTAAPTTPRQTTTNSLLDLQTRTQEITTVRYNPPYVSSIKNNSGNLPNIYLNNKSKKPTGLNNTCAIFPGLFNLHFRSDHWQVQKTSNGTIYLLNAYLDKRDNVIRIVVAYDVYRTELPLYCQFWYSSSTKPIIVQSEVPFWLFCIYCGADSGYFIHPYLITCPVVLHDGNLPVSVSLVENQCDSSTNNLKIFVREYEKKKNFVVCVKGLSFPYDDESVRLAEWIEVVRILGADKINFYEFNVHPNAQNVLDYYVSKGFVEVTPITIAGDFSNHPLLQYWFLQEMKIARRLQEVIPYNDCLYKHLHEYRYVVLLDTDEVIVPVDDTWVELIQTLEEKYPNVSSYMARNVYFFDEYLDRYGYDEDIPKYMHMLQHVYRAKKYTEPGQFLKGFHDTEKVVALQNHLPYSCRKECNPEEIDVNLVHLQHYRADCTSDVQRCKLMKAISVLDKRLLKFKDPLIGSLQTTLKYLGLNISDLT